MLKRMSCHRMASSSLCWPLRMSMPPMFTSGSASTRRVMPTTCRRYCLSSLQGHYYKCTSWLSRQATAAALRVLILHAATSADAAWSASMSARLRRLPQGVLVIA